MMLAGLAPKVRKIAMSARLSVTVITKVLTRLNAATATIRVRMMNIMRFSICTAANQVRLARVQSRTITSTPSTGASSAATSRANCGSLSLTRKPVGPSSLKMRCASLMCIKAKLASYSKWPVSITPTTRNCFKRGTTPSGVTCPPGAIKVTCSPGLTPSWRANSAPNTTANASGCNCANMLGLTCATASVTAISCAGSMPRTMAPRMSSPCAISTCDNTKGAYANTCGCCANGCANAGTSISEALV